MMGTLPLSAGDKVLVLFTSDIPPESLKSTVEALNQQVTSSGKLSIEHTDRLLTSEFPAGTFDVILSGIILPFTSCQSFTILAELARILKPGGKIIIQEPVHNGHSQLRSRDKVVTDLKLAGFVDAKEASTVPITNEDLDIIRKKYNVENIEIVRIEAKKPQYEVGSSAKLSFSMPKTENTSENSTAVWSLSANDMLDDDDAELIDDDELLDESDLNRPDTGHKGGCGGKCSGNCGKKAKPKPKKKKACKNCTCGLADESDDSKPKENTPQSACGNCYLGDAFRCASCPYLGMPAFKPGEKIELPATQLKADQ